MISGAGKTVLILGVQVPFTRGGAEILIDGLIRELKNREFLVDLVQLPFSPLPKTSLVQEMALWRSLRLESFGGREVDLVIPTKFPSYLAPHKKKSLWLVHQLRQLYELYDSRFSDFETSIEDESIREMVFQADRVGLSECQARFTIARNVSQRLDRYFRIDSQALLPPPPLEGKYRSGTKGEYILSVGRICSIKRVDLMIRALAHVSRRLKLKIVGTADEPAIGNYLRSEVEKHHLADRVEFLGRVSEESLLELFADCFAVYYAPHDEDYGFVSIEARLSGKPVVTAQDSGTVLDFIAHEENGLVALPNETSIAAAFNRLLEDEVLYERVAPYGNAADKRNSYASWGTIIEQLTKPLFA